MVWTEWDFGKELADLRRDAEEKVSVRFSAVTASKPKQAQQGSHHRSMFLTW